MATLWLPIKFNYDERVHLNYKLLLMRIVFSYKTYLAQKKKDKKYLNPE